jgi:hypothetical protein
MLAAMVVPAILGSAAPAAAATARAQFGIRLVIEPACADDAPKLVASAKAAIDLAGDYLLLPPQTLSADHDVADTGYWLVRSEQGPVLRVAKCTGAVSRPEATMPDAPAQNAQTQNARSLAEPGASQASG